MPDPNDWNQKIIDEFRTHGGKVGGQFEGAAMILVQHTGAKTGTRRVNPLMYQAVGKNFAVFASNAGAPSNPDWYYNLLAHPRTIVEVGTETIEVTARVTDGAEREQIWDKQKTDYPGFADFEKAITRQIPVVILERVS